MQTVSSYGVEIRKTEYPQSARHWKSTGLRSVT